MHRLRVGGCGLLAEGGKNRLGIALFPAAIRLLKNGGAVLFHLIDRRDRCVGFFVARAPDQQLEQDGGESDAFSGKKIMKAAAVIGRGLGLHNAAGFELLQPVSQDVGGDSFAGVLEFTESAAAADHYVADEQQRPPVTQQFQGPADRASRTPLRDGPLRHGKIVLK